MPVHVVTLACLINSFVRSGKSVYLRHKDDVVGEYLFPDLKV